ncbi:MAG TPA: trypsin-like peptidase domain-containing protein [Gemmatimonadales bacterium]|nr:trypsin-like peptidase domain-containing protein [Gemmatimonadales bacterium]
MSQGWLRRLRSGGVGFAFALGLLAAGFLQLPHSSVAQQQGTTIGTAAPEGRVPPAGAAALLSLSEAFASIAEQVKPSVVYIKSGRNNQARNEREAPRMEIPPGFERFFRNFPMPQVPRFQESSGSGFIVSKDGYILTNNHVIDGSSQVTVRLLDRREFKAKVIGTDPTTDLAVLKIDAPNLVPAPLGSSSAARVGEWVLAVGNPLGDNLTFTVTSGIISAKGRTLALPGQSDRSIQDFIQTDAAINPGNSGGPLVSVRGEVIGVNSAIASQTGLYSGYGFAIPIDLVRKVMDQIIANGRVNRAALGVSVQNATANDAAYVGLPDIRGVLVQDFTENSPARKAGIQPGDIIISVDGKPVEYVGQLQQQVGFRKAGEKVKVEVARKGGVRKTIEVQLQEVPQPRDIAGRTDSADDLADNAGEATIDLLGLTVQPVDQEAAARFDLSSEQRGVLVTEVAPGGPSYGEVAEPGSGGPDIILELEGKVVKTPADLRQALRQFKAGDIVSLRIYNTQAKTRRIERIRLAN